MDNIRFVAAGRMVCVMTSTQGAPFPFALRRPAVTPCNPLILSWSIDIHKYVSTQSHYRRNGRNGNRKRSASRKLGAKFQMILYNCLLGQYESMNIIYQKLQVFQDMPVRQIRNMSTVYIFSKPNTLQLQSFWETWS